MQDFKRIYISDSYALNTGDLGILFSTLQEINKYAPETHIVIESSHPKFLRTYNEVSKYPVYPRIFNIENLTKNTHSKLKIVIEIINGIRDSVLLFLWALLHRLRFPSYWILPSHRKEQAKALADSDLILSSGGGFLSSYYMYGFRLQVYSIAFLLKKPIAIFAQSVGPFKTKLSRIIVPYFLRRMSLITIREQDSYEYLKKMMPDLQIHLVNDIAFLLRKDSTIDTKFSHLFTKPAVAFCLKNNSKEEYSKAIVDCANFLKSKNYNVILASQTPADDTICRAIALKLDLSSHIVPFGISPCQLKAIYSNCEFIIANRMHAIVFAASQIVPFVCLAYEPKFSGLMSQLNYPKQYLIPESTPTKALEAVKRLHLNKNECRTSLRNIQAQITREAKNCVRLLFKKATRV